MSTSDIKKNQITLQGPQNYLEWASGMCPLLMVFGVWRYANTNVAAPAAAADVPAHEKNQDQCLGLITSFVSGVIRQNYLNEGNPNTVWEALRTAYGTPGAAGIFVEFKKIVCMQIKKHNDPATRINEMQSIFGYLAANGLTLPDSAQAMILLSALPNEWEGFASTILATLPVTLPAGAPAGAQALTFALVLSKINEEWSRRSGNSVMLKNKEDRKESNAFAGLSKVNKLRCKTCNGRHSTKDHIDGYKRPNAPQAGPSQLKKPFIKGKGKKDYKGKGKQRANAAEQVTLIIMLNSNGETDNEDTGYASQNAEAGWSVTTQSILNADSSSLLEDERYMRRKQMDDEYARRLATAPKEEYDPYYDDVTSIPKYTRRLDFTTGKRLTEKDELPKIAKQ